MEDIFDATIICKNCKEEMKKVNVEQEGFVLRAVECPKCRSQIIHPTDLNNWKQYNSLKHKTFNVKLRVVGNSHAVSIPKEIVDFINQSHQRMERHMSDMVRLCFEDFDRLSLRFDEPREREKIKHRQDLHVEDI